MNWWHHLDITWLFKTEKSAKQMRDDLRTLGYIDGNDELFVIDVTGRASACTGSLSVRKVVEGQPMIRNSKRHMVGDHVHEHIAEVVWVRP